MDERIRKEVDEWVALTAALSELRTSVPLGETLKLSLGRVLLGIALRDGMSAVAFASVTDNQVRHICDWLTAAISRGERWLSRVDDQGQPLKLMKFGTVAQIIDEADKAMAKRRGDAASLKPDAGGTKFVYDAGDGWSLVRLLTSQALDIEGMEMGHCVGQGGYDYGLSNNFTGIYSLRDPIGKSHVTIEINHPLDRVEQIKGKQNKPPKAQYMRRLLGWRGLKGMAVARTELPPGFAVDRNRGVVELAGLEPGDEFVGNIEVELAKGQDDYVLPLLDGVTVRGDVVIMGLKAGRLVGDGQHALMRYPAVTIRHGVKIDGELKLDHVTMDIFSVEARKLTVRNSTIRSIAAVECHSAEFSASQFETGALAGASFSGHFDLRSSPGVVFHPSTKIAHTVSVSGCRPILGQPENPVEFREGFVANRLDVFNSLAAFGDDYHVAGHLDILQSTVKRMPSSLSVRGDLRVKECIIDRWPEAMTVGGSTIESQVVVSENAPQVERPAWVPELFAY
ncbi:hypothetical protein HFO56_01570 [Rhizobium laguerreae]|uniref:PcfJ domain-containing protein n=1 Tax=Rhizobium laguerreae TaxID=1076926 RepID=UPI001C905E32|nr:PcfJ domain-containing protein [Rhizobium laguerreae]MBY3151099.1 hypothetical protein [Rhizobium laguerreae]